LLFDFQLEERKGKCGKTTLFKGTSSVKGTPSLVQVHPPLEFPRPSKPVTPANLNMDVSNEFDDEEDDLVSFDGKKDPCGRLNDDLAHSRLSRNIALVTQKRKQSVFSPKSFETEYSFESQTSMTVCSPEEVGTC